jgi:hypothetical protein
LNWLEIDEFELGLLKPQEMSWVLRHRFRSPSPETAIAKSLPRL